jgi:hypothetical protein
MAIIAPSGASFLVPTGRSPEGIAVFDEPELSGQSYRVDSDGMITFWLLGRVAAGGLTLRQFQDRLRDQLANGYITRRDISLCSRERAEDRGVADRVRFIGERSDVGRLLAAASVHCQANLRPEPFGIALVEALAVGLPVVTVVYGRRGRDCRRIVRHAHTPRDPHALASALRRPVCDPVLRARLSAAAAARARHVSDPTAQMRRLHCALQTIVQGRARQDVPDVPETSERATESSSDLVSRERDQR